MICGSIHPKHSWGAEIRPGVIGCIEAKKFHPRMAVHYHRCSLLPEGRRVLPFHCMKCERLIPITGCSDSLRFAILVLLQIKIGHGALLIQTTRAAKKLVVHCHHVGCMQVSFVNSICTLKGGTHVKLIVDQICKCAPRIAAVLPPTADVAIIA
jgi:hypothetical protein